VIDAAPPACGLAAARAAIVQTHLKMQTIGDSPTRIAPSSADEVVCARQTMAVSIASGGTAGDIGFVLFRRTPTGWRVALTRGGYKLGLFRAGVDVVESQPVYRKNDPNCCPSGGFDHVRFDWNGLRYVAARAWHTKSFGP
jgi:hypothetical protein